MFKRLLGLKSDAHFDALTVTENWAQYLPAQLPKEGIRRKALDVLLSIGIPFNRWLGLKIKEISPDRVVIESPPTVLRRNHVGTAHACAQALIGEYAAGLVVAQHFPMESYRFIIGHLEINYTKPGRGHLFGCAEAPVPFPILDNGEGWVPMQTRITNEAGEEVAVCTTRWQVKSWVRIESDRVARKVESATAAGANAEKSNESHR
jgi:acyl-coenzyme A thioesterase PaaI-like protein